MYWPAEDVPFASRTTTLNEELGQVCLRLAQCVVACQHV